MVKNYSPISLFSVVRKISEKLLNERLVDHPETCNSFSNFQYAFRSLRLTVHLLTVVSDRIALAFDRSWTSEAVVLDVSKALGRVRGTSLFHKFKSYRILGWVFDIISSFFFVRDSLGCSEVGRGLSTSMLGKLNLFCLTVQTSLLKIHLLRRWVCLYLLHWNQAFTLSLQQKLLSRKWKPWFILWSYILLSYNTRYWINYKNNY